MMKHLYSIIGLLFCMSGAVKAQSSELKVNVETAGTLPTLITDAQKFTVSKIKISGPLNGTDVNFIREMAGVNSENNDTEGILSSIDLSDATIKAGGDSYLSYYSTDSWSDVMRVTKDDVFPADFFHGTRVSKVVLPATITKIDSCAFQNCPLLTSIEFPEKVTELETDAFSGSGLTALTLPSTITKIGSYCFWGCANLASVDLKAQLSEIAEGTFCQDNFKEINIPEDVLKIGTGAFQYCYSLEKVTGGSNVTSIGSYAFNQCGKLTDITLPETLEEMGLNAFANCASLQTVNIPVGVSYIGKECFINCGSLTKFTVDEANEYYKAAAGVLYSKDGKTLVCCPAGMTDEVDALPEVETIADNAFDHCVALKSVILHDKLTSVGNDAFNFCGVLEKLTCYAVEPPTIGWSGAFFLVPDECVLYVMPESKDKYAAADGWKDFKNIEEIGSTGIGVINADAEAEYYTVGGLRTSAIRHGLNIVRMNDGKVVKVMK